MFRAAAEAGVRYLRMDFAIGAVFQFGGTDFSGVDRVNALAARYGVQVLGVITATPWYIADCPEPEPFSTSNGAAPPRARGHLARHGLPGRPPRRQRPPVGARQRAGQRLRVQRRCRPNTRAGRPSPPRGSVLRARTPGSPSAASRALDRTYVEAALHDPVHPLLGQIDIANVHVRGSLRAMRTAAGRARRSTGGWASTAALWVTETGYPSDVGLPVGPRAARRPAGSGQVDRARSALPDRRRRRRRVRRLPRQSRVRPREPWASEGLVLWPQLGPDGRPCPKPAFWALQRLARRSDPWSAEPALSAARRGGPCRSACAAARRRSRRRAGTCTAP